MAQSALKNIRASGIRAINLDEGDELIAVIQTTGDDTVIIATRNGMATGFHESSVRPMGRTAVGVRGIRLREGDYVIGAGCTSEGSDVLTVTENGFGKRTEFEAYSVHNRGGLGVKNYQVTEKTGKIAAIRIVDETDDLLVITDDGTIIRVPVAGIRRTGRSAQGVCVMKLSGDAKVICVEKTEHFAEEEQPEEPAAETAEESPDAE